MKVRISGKARAELLNIYSYFAEQNPRAAESVLRDIDAKLQQLSQFPFMGRERPEFAPNLRSVLVRTFLVFYTVGKEDVVILRIIDGRMDLDEEFRRQI